MLSKSTLKKEGGGLGRLMERGFFPLLFSLSLSV